MVVVIIVTVNRNIDNVSSFKEFIALYKDDIYNRLVSYFPTSGPAEFNKMAMTYTERKGQYRRPSYIMLWNRLYGGVDEDAVLPAAAQQASEDYFLMHDDNNIMGSRYGAALTGLCKSISYSTLLAAGKPMA